MYKYLIAVVVVMSGFNFNAHAGVDFENSVKDVSSGVGRFRFGGYVAGSFVKSQSKLFQSSSDEVEVFGLGLEGGGYMLFNAIRDTADMEIGLGYKHAFSTEVDDGGSKKSTSSLSYFNTYAGLVFQLESQSAIAAGFIIQLGNGDSLTSEKTPQKGKSLSLNNGVGTYIEYQQEPDEENRLFYYRLELMSFAFENSIESVRSSVVSFSVGYKF